MSAHTTTDTAFAPAEAFPVGEFLRDELEARGWTATDFSEILGRPQQAVSEILNGRKSLTAQTATEIAAATGTDAATWLRLQDVHQLWQQSQRGAGGGLGAVTRRARLRSLVPVGELRSRGLVPNGELDEQERAVCELLKIRSITDRPEFKVAARRSSDDEPLLPAQVAWLATVRKVAASVKAVGFDDSAAEALGEQLSQSVLEVDDLRLLPRRFARTGIRVVYVKPFRGSKIDGVAFRDERGPVVGISGRIARLDSVLFTLLHELAHVTLRHIDRGYAIDLDLESETTNRNELAADRKASAWVLPSSIEISTPITRAKVIACARKTGVHPALVIGRLQHDGTLPWSHLRALVPSVRAKLEAW